MFIVVYGLTGDIGDRVRDYFKEQGFKKLKKYYYTKSEKDRQRLLSKNETVYDSPEALDKFDYKYVGCEHLVGFDQAALDRASKGEEDLFTSISCTDINFLKTIKAQNNVTIVYAYIDDATLEALTLRYDESQRENRLKIGKQLKNVYLNNVRVFDRVVLYGGEGSVFNSSVLFSQLDTVVEKARTDEVTVISDNKVRLPYIGNREYIFVSYSHDDEKEVRSIIHKLQRQGYRIWYDTGLDGGDKWPDVLRDKIRNCRNFLLFTSEHSVRSENVKIEIVSAFNFEKKIVVVRIDDADFEGRIGDMLKVIHTIDARKDTFESEIVKALDRSTIEVRTDDVPEMS